VTLLESNRKFPGRIGKRLAAWRSSPWEFRELGNRHIQARNADPINYILEIFSGIAVVANNGTNDLVMKMATTFQ
jgi:hypothetical protein